MRVLAPTGALLLCTLLGACGSTPSPRVAIDKATLASRSPEGVVLAFAVTLENPGDEPLPLRDVAYRVRLDGKPVFRGVRSPQATLPAFGRVSFVLPASVTGDPGAASVAYQIEGDIAYLKPGALAESLADADLAHPKAHFSTSGTIDLAKLDPPPEGPAREFRRPSTTK